MITNKVLLIGGAGFIGIHTAKLLESNGYVVAIVDNFSSSENDELIKKYKVFELDACNFPELEKVYDNFRPDVVYIFSSVVDVPVTIKSPLTVRSGILSLMNACELGLIFNVKLNVYASSGYVYGNKNPLPYTEQTSLDPVNPYNISKIYCESFLSFYHQKYGLDSAIMRYAPTYGPRRRIGPINDFIRRASIGQQVELFGTVTRDYIFVEDVALANLNVLKKMPKGSNAYNIGTGIELTMVQVYHSVCEALKCKPREIIHNQANSNEINRFYLDCSKACLELDFKYKNTLHDGLSKTISWLGNTNDS